MLVNCDNIIGALLSATHILTGEITQHIAAVCLLVCAAQRAQHEQQKQGGWLPEQWKL